MNIHFKQEDIPIISCLLLQFNYIIHICWRDKSGWAPFTLCIKMCFLCPCQDPIAIRSSPPVNKYCWQQATRFIFFSSVHRINKQKQHNGRTCRIMHDHHSHRYTGALSISMTTMLFSAGRKNSP